MLQLLRRWTREQRGSHVAQAAGVALVVTVVVSAIFGSLDVWQAGVATSLRCYVGGFDTGGCGSGAGIRTSTDAAARPLPATTPGSRSNSQTGAGPVVNAVYHVPIQGEPEPRLGWGDSDGGSGYQQVSSRRRIVNALRSIWDRYRARQNSRGLNAEELSFTRTVENHLDDLTKSGEPARPYMRSRILLQEIMNSRPPVRDSSVPTAWRWEVPGVFKNGVGTWELVVDERTKTVLHWMFRSTPP